MTLLHIIVPLLTTLACCRPSENSLAISANGGDVVVILGRIRDGVTSDCPIEGSLEINKRILECLWILQEPADLERNEFELRYYEEFWRRANLLFETGGKMELEALKEVGLKIRLDGGERLAFAEKLIAMEQRLKKS
jgi:hypothetical protein